MLRISASVLSVLVVAPFLAVGCGDSGSSSTGDTGGAPAGGACAPAEGCPSVVSDCVAFEDNAGKDVFSLRIVDLQLSAPAALASPVVAGLLSTGITPDYEQCVTKDSLALFTGDGSFNWILTFDKTAGILRTGGAVLETNPDNGYCFINETIDGFDVAPLELPLTIDGSGAFTLEGTEDVVVPIYTSPTDTASVILLPLRGVSIKDGVISADNNCMGSFNADGLDPNNLCKASTSTPAFNAGAKLEGFVTLEDGDAVKVPQLGDASLCSLLAPEDSTDGKCNRDAGGVITYKGDWCAATDSAATADCADAVRLLADFAAAGVKLRDDCP